MKELGIVFNDVHLAVGNDKKVIEAFDYMVEYALSKNINRMFFAGDLFDSRTSQRIDSLKTFEYMLEKLHSKGIISDWIPGNHDKTTYSSYNSFLDPYKYHPGVTLHRDISNIVVDGVKITLCPFFSDDMLVKKLESHEGGDILISHFGMQGSTHLAHKADVEESPISRNTLKKWGKTFLGHFHNYHEITKDIVHLPSFIQDGFGEDSVKGFSVIYEDGSYELIKGKFKEFEKVVVDVDDTSILELGKLIKSYENSDNSVRFVLDGSESKVKSIDLSMFNDTGIDVKAKYEQKFSYNDEDKDVPKIIDKHTKSSIKDSFKSFCEKKEYDYDFGKKILEEFLKKI